MQEEPKNSEEYIKEIIQKSKISETQKNEKRVSKILSRARRDIGLRDFITLIFVRFWIVLAEMACTIFARQKINQKPNRSAPDGKVNQEERSNGY